MNTLKILHLGNKFHVLKRDYLILFSQIHFITCSEFFMFILIYIS